MATTTTTSSTASAVSTLTSSLGAGSGIDMGALATNLASAQFAGRTDRLTDRAASLDKQISAASSLKSLMLQLSSSLGSAVRTGALSTKPQVDAAVATATLTGTGRPSGSYTLEVTTLAAGQTLTSPAYAKATATVGSGTLTLRFGTLTHGSGTQSGFAEDGAHASVPITISAGATLGDVANAITNAGAGVTAYVAQTTSGARLVLKGAEGAANGFVLDASEDPGDPGLASLAWGPGDDAERVLRSAADAAVKVDGLTVATSGNTVAGAIPGMTLKLTGTNAGAPTAVSFADPSSAIASAMEDFTAALNEVTSELGTDTDAQTGALSRDSGARALRSALSQLAGKVIMPNAVSGAPRTLADLGLTLQRGGSFTLDSNRLSATLTADPQGAAAMFTTGLYGVYAAVDSLARTTASAGTPGSLAASVSRYTAQKTQVTADQAKLTTQQAALRTQLIARFAVADTSVGASKSTLTFLQNQIAAWNAEST